MGYSIRQLAWTIQIYQCPERQNKGNMGRRKAVLYLKRLMGHLGGLVCCLTLDFGSDHALTASEFQPQIGLSEEPTWDAPHPTLRFMCTWGGLALINSNTFSN